MKISAELIQSLALVRYFGPSTIQRELKVGWLTAQHILCELLLKGLAAKAVNTSRFEMTIPPNENPISLN